MRATRRVASRVEGVARSRSRRPSSSSGSWVAAARTRLERRCVRPARTCGNGSASSPSTDRSLDPLPQFRLRAPAARRRGARSVELGMGEHERAVPPRDLERRGPGRRGTRHRAGRSALKRSWTKPGSISSPDRTEPPGSFSASSTITDQPASARTLAATSPLCPAPTTTASCTNRVTSRTLSPLQYAKTGVTSAGMLRAGGAPAPDVLPRRGRQRADRVHGGVHRRRRADRLGSGKRRATGSPSARSSASPSASPSTVIKYRNV